MKSEFLQFIRVCASSSPVISAVPFEKIELLEEALKNPLLREKLHWKHFSATFPFIARLMVSLESTSIPR